jgi:hypothetical protein
MQSTITKSKCNEVRAKFKLKTTTHIKSEKARLSFTYYNIIRESQSFPSAPTYLQQKKIIEN